MNTQFAAPLLALSIVLPTSATLIGALHGRADSISQGERTALAAASDARLASMRAGRVAAAPTMNTDERDALRAAAKQSPQLREMRAGDGLTTVLLVVVVVVLVLLII